MYIWMSMPVFPERRLALRLDLDCSKIHSRDLQQYPLGRRALLA